MNFFDLTMLTLVRPSTSECGVDGQACRPFQDKTLAFRCSAECQATIISTTEHVGDQEINYRSVVIGGSNETESNRSFYRGDSFICAAAIHAGLFPASRGGAGVVALLGEHGDFPSTEANGINSIGFGPSFPLSFTFLDIHGSTMRSCDDPNMRLLSLTAVWTITTSSFTTSPPVFFASICFDMYIFVALAFDPPDFEHFSSVVSKASRGLLPATFVGLVVYRYCVRRTLAGLKAQVEKTVLWLGGCWLGCLNRITFDRLPIQRLTPHDLQQPGAILTVGTLLLLIVAAAFAQAWALRMEGRLITYLIFYSLLGLLLLSLMVIPYVNVRLHHYIIALLLIPGTAIQTRPSLIFQGLLVGLFISGIARWGFDSIIQTPGDLFESGYNDPIPQVLMPTFLGDSNLTINFSWSNEATGHDSLSIVVDDVERFRGSEDDSSENFNWTRSSEDGQPTYVRFAYVKYKAFGPSAVGRYTQPAIWYLNGTWAPN